MSTTDTRDDVAPTTSGTASPDPEENAQARTVVDAHTAVRVHTVVTVDLALYANNVAFTSLSTLHEGDLNVWGNSLPAGTFPVGPVMVDDIEFRPPPTGRAGVDNVRCEGQYLVIPELGGCWLHLLATSERRCEETVHLHFASGTVDPEWLRVSDFWPAEPHFGERLAARGAMHYPHHRQDDLTGQVWAVRVPVRRSEPLVGLRLPDNPALHVFAVSVEAVS